MRAPLQGANPRPLDSLELRRLQLAIEASGEVVFTTDADGIFTYVNPEFERTYGYTASELVGLMTPRILKSGTTAPEIYSQFWALLRSNQVVKRQFINRTKRGDVLHIEASVNPMVDDQGCVVGFVAVQRDVTARDTAVAALRESEHRYRTLADAAQDSIFIVNRDAELEYANGVIAERLGMAVGEVVGRRLDEVFPKDQAAEMWDELSEVFATGQRQLRERRFQMPHGDLWLELWLVPMRGDDATVRTVMGVGRDVTDRKSLERQLLQAQKMEGIGRLAGGIAHDFNNLLTSILGHCEFLRERATLGPDVLADVDEIRKAGERAHRLTRQLLAFSRKQPMTREVVDLRALVADIQRMLGRTIGDDIELSVAAEAGIPHVVADPGQIEQVLVNLAVNARDAMPKGGRLTVSLAGVSLDEQFVRHHLGATMGSYVALTVRDAGCGMSPDVLAHAFEPFFTTKSHGHGTGLGLSTVYGIVKQNRGYVTIDSVVNEGTVVTVFWPAATCAAPEPSFRASLPPRAVDGTETILLVEDEPGIRGLMRRSLEPRGYRVLETRDVAHAIDLAATYEGAIDLLLSDVIMPGLNGPDLAQRIVALRPSVRILYVSGFPNSLVAEQGRRRGRVAFLAKPFTPQALAEKIRECLKASV